MAGKGKVGRPSNASKSKKESANTTTTPKALSEIDENYMLKFASSIASALNNPIFYNPIMQNEILKDINMHPSKYDRDAVEKLLLNPRDNELATRNLAQYLDTYIMQFKRLADYYAKILVFDYTLEPTNADEEDMSSKPFKKSWNKVCDWLDDFDIKTSLQEVMKGVMLEDAKFYYIRKSDSGIRLQEMASDYCEICYKDDNGYGYAFNMMYFLRPGVSLAEYDPVFTDYYNDFLSYKQTGLVPDSVTVKKRNGQFFYWQELPNVKAPVFKYHATTAGMVSPLAGTFIDAVEIATYKQLLRTKTSLQTWKMLINRIPRNANSKSGNTKDDFALLADTAGKASSIMQSAVPEGATNSCIKINIFLN